MTPGKAILCGEYAVLDGAPAISVAVDRFVSAHVADGTPASPFVAAAVKHTLAFLRGRNIALPEALESGRATVTLDSTALYDGADKLGLGSSAAVTVAACVAVLEAAGHHAAPRDIFEIADEAHAEAQGVRGSGIDVATSAFAGPIRFQRSDEKVDIRPVALPRDLVLTFIFTGRSASTPKLIEKVRAFQARAPEEHASLAARLLSTAQSFAAACEADDASAAIEAAREYADDMRALGDSAGCEIVTREHALLDEIARKFGGAGKPSGAGGGDLGVAFTLGSDVTTRFHQALIEAGLRPLSLSAIASKASTSTERS